LVVECLLWGHVRRHIGAAGHLGSASWDLCVVVFGRVDGTAVVDAIGIGRGRFGRVQAGLDEVLALGLGNEGLELRCREGIDEASFGHD